jgi:hypothetical protein
MHALLMHICATALSRVVHIVILATLQTCHDQVHAYAQSSQVCYVWPRVTGGCHTCWWCRWVAPLEVPQDAYELHFVLSGAAPGGGKKQHQNQNDSRLWDNNAGVSQADM